MTNYKTAWQVTSDDYVVQGDAQRQVASNTEKVTERGTRMQVIHFLDGGTAVYNHMAPVKVLDKSL